MGYGAFVVVGVDGGTTVVGTDDLAATVVESADVLDAAGMVVEAPVALSGASAVEASGDTTSLGLSRAAIDGGLGIFVPFGAITNAYT